MQVSVGRVSWLSGLRLKSACTLMSTQLSKHSDWKHLREQVYRRFAAGMR